MTFDIGNYLSSVRAEVDEAIDEVAENAAAELPGPIGNAIAYSLTSPGKRLRPILLASAYRELGGTGAVATLAVSVEVVHAYSLVHDDLPCMDDDELRRGRPTTHVEFGVEVATEAALRMVPLAANVLARGAGKLGLGSEVLSRLGIELFAAAGAQGMVGGQVLDLEAENKPVSELDLRRIHAGKTGALITAATTMGAIAAGVSEDIVEAFRGYGRNLGLAFQIVDDVLDATSTSEELGKTAGKDAKQLKATFATLLGIDTARKEASTSVDTALAGLRGAGVDSEVFCELSSFVIERRR